MDYRGFAEKYALKLNRQQEEAVRSVEGNVLLLEKSKAGALTQTVELAGSASAPVAAGDRLGTLTVTAGEETVAEIPILAGETVPRITFSQMLVRLLRIAFLAG